MKFDVYAYKCKVCGHVMYPYRTLCRKCGDNEHADFDIVPLAKTGTLVTYTHLYTLPSDYETVTLTLGIVKLDDGNKMTAQLNIKEPKLGMKVKGDVTVVREDAYSKHRGMVFTAQ